MQLSRTTMWLERTSVANRNQKETVDDFIVLFLGKKRICLKKL